MGRVGYKYYVIVNSTTGRLDENCSKCQVIRSSTSQPNPNPGAGHTLIETNKALFNNMLERDVNGKYKKRWNIGQGRPEDDT